MASNAEVIEKVTDNIIQALENGTVPWQTPWTPTATNGPTSLATGKPYQGINHLILSLVGMDYEGPSLWGTYNQAKALGGYVPLGVHGTPVMFWKPMERVEDGEKKKFLLARQFTVFHVTQMEGITIPSKWLVEREPVPVLDGVDQALHYPNGPEVRHMEQNGAFYVPSEDRITLPLVEQFTSAERYAATALHEAVHSTGAEHRLKRDIANTFGCQEYAREELVAEIGAAMLATMLGIRVEWEQHGAYVASWLRVLKDDRKLITQAATQAQKAADHIMNGSEEQE